MRKFNRASSRSVERLELPFGPRALVAERNIGQNTGGGTAIAQAGDIPRAGVFKTTNLVESVIARL